MQTPPATTRKAQPTGHLGTFAGVFTPSILTILGIILFLRLGYVVGQAGLGRALLMIALANAISVLTSVSLSAVATNLKVKGGGDYYLISRTLGMTFGGSIGIVLFLAQSVSIGFYSIGFGEAASVLLPPVAWASPRIIAFLAIGFLFVLAWLGADWATRFQYGVMALLTAALVSFFWGGLPAWHLQTVGQNWRAIAGGQDFWVLFAIFFPAVTGFTQGVSMSGDLKDPGKSLPQGTFAAVGVSVVVYFSVAVVFAGCLPAAVMVEDYGAMRQVARFGGLVDAGVMAATLSSAMASFLGGPRILQALAADRVFPVLTPFAKGSKNSGNPRRAVLLSGGIALLTVAMGQLNLIAQVVSMFFLISYGLLNYATYFEARSASPSFRPRFRWFDARLSLLGCLTCLGVMMAIDVKTSATALAVLVAIHQYLRRTAGPSRWADGSRSHHLQRMRTHLLGAAGAPEHPRDWRPVILAFTHTPERRFRLLTFADWLAGGSGLTAAVRILEGAGAGLHRRKKEAEDELRSDIARRKLNAFPLVVAAADMSAGISVLLQAYGIGPVQANCILINWLDQMGRGITGIGALKYAENLRQVFRAGRNVIVLHADEQRWQGLADSPPEDRRIDVWWHDDATGRLMLLLAYLVTRAEGWHKARIRLIAEHDAPDRAGCTGQIKTLLEDIRIDAVPEIVEKADAETVLATSAAAALVFLPFRIRQYKLLDSGGMSLERILPGLPTTALVMAAEDIDLGAEPEEGTAGELAAVADAAVAARAAAEAAEKEADQAAQAAAALEDRAKDSEGGRTADPGLEKQVQAARGAAEKAFRKAARRRVKADEAAERAVDLGAVEPEDAPDD